MVECLPGIIRPWLASIPSTNGKGPEPCYKASIISSMYGNESLTCLCHVLQKRKEKGDPN